MAEHVYYCPLRVRVDSSVINAIAEAGLCVKKMMETRAPDKQSPLLSQLPKYMAWVAEKEDS